MAQSRTLHLLDNIHTVASPDLKKSALWVTAKKLMNGESFDDFFNRNIEFVKGSSMNENNIIL